MRSLVAVLVGAVLANLLIFGWEWALAWLPFGGAAAAHDLQAPESVATMPLEAQWWVVSGWLLGTLAGSFAAFRIARSDWTGWVVAGLVGAAGIANVLMLPHPLWMRLAAVAAPFVGAVFGFGLYRRWRAAHLHLKR